MLAQDHLTLKLIRLKPPEEGIHPAEGLFLIFPKGGAAQFVSGAVKYRLAPGDVLVLNGAAGGKLCVLKGAEMLFWCFSLCFEHVCPLFATHEIRLLQTVIDDFKAPKLYPASSAVAATCHRLLADVPPEVDLNHRSQLLRVFAAILTVEFKNGHGQPGGFIRVEEHMVQVFEKLSADDLLTLSVGELAGKFNCSRRHLSRLFHQHFGFSVAALRMEMRLLKALSLLQDPDAKVIHVAERCGFNHLGLFNTCFKRRFGASPGQWRKMPERVESQLHGLLEGNVTCPLRAYGLCQRTGNGDDNCLSLPETSRTPKADSTRP